jgi:hypothetical protein
MLRLLSRRSALLSVSAVALLLALSLSSSAFAASYEKTGGAIVDPILYRSLFGGGPHPYSGPNLEDHAILTGADLSDAVLAFANLDDAVLTNADLTGALLYYAVARGADLANADLYGANLIGADLSGADLSSADLFFAYLNDTDLTNADLSGAILAFAYLLDAVLTGSTYDEFTLFPSNNTYDIQPWGLPNDAAPWSLGMIPVPEPSFGLLLLSGVLGLAGLAAIKGGA